MPPGCALRGFAMERSDGLMARVPAEAKKILKYFSMLTCKNGIKFNSVQNLRLGKLIFVHT
jgi:hypothetical protein